MQTKTCTKCGIEKDISNYYYRNDNNTYRGVCISCCLESNKIQRAKNKDLYYKQHKKYCKAHKKEIAEYKKQWILEHKKEIAEYQKQWILEHKKEIAEYQKQWALEHKKELREYRKQYVKTRCTTDIPYKLTIIVRSRISRAIKKGSGKRAYKSMELLGCTIEEARQHLETQFTEGMSWDNHGKWHIDHIRPCASFDLTDPEQQKQCFNYKNLQPLWAIDNLNKSDNWEND